MTPSNMAASDTTALIGRVNTRQPYSRATRPLQVFHVTMENDRFIVFASCEAMVRLVAIDRRRLKKLTGTKILIKRVGPAMTMMEEAL